MIVGIQQRADPRVAMLLTEVGVAGAEVATVKPEDLKSLHCVSFLVVIIGPVKYAKEESPEGLTPNLRIRGLQI